MVSHGYGFLDPSQISEREHKRKHRLLGTQRWVKNRGGFWHPRGYEPEHMSDFWGFHVLMGLMLTTQGVNDIVDYFEIHEWTDIREVAPYVYNSLCQRNLSAKWLIDNAWEKFWLCYGINITEF